MESANSSHKWRCSLWAELWLYNKGKCCLFFISNSCHSLFLSMRGNLKTIILIKQTWFQTRSKPGPSSVNHRSRTAALTSFFSSYRTVAIITFLHFKHKYVAQAPPFLDPCTVFKEVAQGAALEMEMAAECPSSAFAFPCSADLHLWEELIFAFLEARCAPPVLQRLPDVEMMFPWVRPERPSGTLCWGGAGDHSPGNRSPFH